MMTAIYRRDLALRTPDILSLLSIEASDAVNEIDSRLRDFEAWPVDRRMPKGALRWTRDYYIVNLRRALC